ncbi:hypothetical protein BGZ51_005692 [Haplosporangium sp. Z 767]|nr:hypothetical protein BGZ51_005692 [Haplosporangium sp. Z 767]
MNSTQYGYHPYPSPSQSQAPAPLSQQQQQQLSPQLQQQQQQQTDTSQQQHQQHQQQLSPQQSPTSSSQQPSPQQQHTTHLNLDHALSATSSTNGNSNNISTNNGQIEPHSPSHSNDPQSPIDADGELIGPTTGISSHHSQHHQHPVVSSALRSPPGGHAQPTTLLPMPSPALAAATAANTAANTNTSSSRQMILQNMAMSMSMPSTSANGATSPVAINTGMMPLHGSSAYMLPSPQSATGQPPLPAIPPQSTDLDTILAKYANQPELLKLIIASKTEEDRRWAEEARYRMMDLIMRGENRGMGFTAGYEALGGMQGNIPGSMMGLSAKRFLEEGGYGPHPSFAGFSPSGTGFSGGVAPGVGGTVGAQSGAPGSVGAVSSLNPSSTAAGTSSSGMPPMYVQSQMSTALGGMGTMGHGTQPMMNQSMGGASGGVGQYMDPSLARKRSVTFAGEVHHMRSQSLSSIPTPSTAGQLNGMSMMGMGGTDAFAQQPYHHHVASGLQGSQQQYLFQQQQQQQQMPFHHHASQPPPPPFAGANPYSHQQFAPQHSINGVHHGGIRRTNSLSHITQSQTTTVTEQRLAAGRPRNDSSTSMRTNMEDDSDEDSDEDYDNHPLMGMASRPGSALSIHNNIGGNGETSLTLEFSDMASVSGGHAHGHHDQGSGGNNSSSMQMMTGSTGGSVMVTTTTMTKAHRSTSSVSSLSAITGDSAGTETSGDFKRKRKRREMQPVNKIVDSPEPHVDPYLWKNNGNTTQKKTGCKSIYYKCSNSNAGCTVNKTVTEKEGGGYVTKYRGEHLEDCIRLKKAQMAAQAAQAAAQNGHHSIQKEP